VVARAPHALRPAVAAAFSSQARIRRGLQYFLKFLFLKFLLFKFLIPDFY
jgi:hypothetical protein